MTQAGAAYRGAGRTASVRRERAARFNRRMLRIAMGLVVLCLFVYIGRMASISAGAKEISRLEAELVKLDEEQKYLQISLAARQNIDRVRDEATGRLGMRYPEEGEVQIVSLNSYASRNNTQTVHDHVAP